MDRLEGLPSQLLTLQSLSRRLNGAGVLGRITFSGLGMTGLRRNSVIHSNWETRRRAIADFLGLPSTIEKLLALGRPVETQPFNIPETPVRTVESPVVKNGLERTPTEVVTSAVKSPVATRDSQIFDSFEQHISASRFTASPPPSPQKASVSANNSSRRQKY